MATTTKAPALTYEQAGEIMRLASETWLTAQDRVVAVLGSGMESEEYRAAVQVDQDASRALRTYIYRLAGLGD